MISIERSLVTPRWQRVALPIVSLVMASIIAGIVLAVSGHDPLDTYRQIYEASFTSAGAVTATFVYATPLLFTGLAVALAFRMRVWNIGGEGQLYMGAVGASGVGLLLGGLPQPLLILAMILDGLGISTNTYSAKQEAGWTPGPYKPDAEAWKPHAYKPGED